MAALDFTNPSYLPYLATETLGAIDAVRLINLPPYPVKLTFYPVTTAAKFVGGQAALAEGATIGANTPFPLGAGAPSELTSFPLTAPHRVYLASATGSQVVYVMMEKIGGEP